MSASAAQNMILTDLWKILLVPQIVGLVFSTWIHLAQNIRRLAHLLWIVRLNSTGFWNLAMFLYLAPQNLPRLHRRQTRNLVRKFPILFGGFHFLQRDLGIFVRHMPLRLLSVRPLLTQHPKQISHKYDFTHPLLRLPNLLTRLVVLHEKSRRLIMMPTTPIRYTQTPSFHPS